MTWMTSVAAALGIWLLSMLVFISLVGV